jgi:hypothetical protein
VFHCHRQPLCGHRTAQKIKHVSFGETLRLKTAGLKRFVLNASERTDGCFTAAFIPSLKGRRKGASLHVTQKRGPYGNRRPFPEPYLAYLSGSSVEEPPPPSRFPSQGSVGERDPIPSALLHSSFNVPGIRAPFQFP